MRELYKVVLLKTWSKRGFSYPVWGLVDTMEWPVWGKATLRFGGGGGVSIEKEEAEILWDFEVDVEKFFS